MRKRNPLRLRDRGRSVEFSNRLLSNHLLSSITTTFFWSLQFFCRHDIENLGSAYQYNFVVAILKIRVADTALQSTSSESEGSVTGKKKTKKKKATAANAALHDSVIYDNAEEAALFKVLFLYIAKCFGVC